MAMDCILPTPSHPPGIDKIYPPHSWFIHSFFMSSSSGSSYKHISKVFYNDFVNIREKYAFQLSISGG